MPESHAMLAIKHYSIHLLILRCALILKQRQTSPSYGVRRQQSTWIWFRHSRGSTNGLLGPTPSVPILGLRTRDRYRISYLECPLKRLTPLDRLPYDRDLISTRREATQKPNSVPS